MHKCISEGLMHVAAWYRGTPGSKFTKFGEQVFISQTHKATKFRRDPTRSVSKIYVPEKVDQSSSKSLNICYAPMPLTEPNFIVLGQIFTRKALQQCSPFSILPPQKEPLGQSLPISVIIKVPNFVPFWQPVYDISAAERRWFRWKRDRQTWPTDRRKAVNDMSPPHMRRQ